ncbi:MAG: TerB family tellurite resistance protein [Leptolyngbyaceae cyanobacterium RU_5_1]|nr:TerB family tellurite resistance protein [Leptolyngbyaceae cyanobacterium RU_5_1]
MKIPHPPGISPKEMNLLRVVCAMAWSDGELSSDELELLITEFSKLFADDETDERHLHEELHGYVYQNLPLAELVPKITTEEDRKLVLQLSYMVILASRRHPDEPLINPAERAAYRQLVELLALPEETVITIERSVNEELDHEENVIHAIATDLGKFLGRE